MPIDKWTLESALDAAVDCLNRHLPGYIQARLDADADRDRPLINGKLPVPKVVTTGMLDDLAADWVTPSIFLNATSTSYQNYNASSLLDSQPRVTATILMAEGDIDTSEQRVYSNALSMYSDGVRYILSTIFPEDGGCDVGVQAATPDSVQYSPLVRPDGYPVWLRWSEVSVVWTQRVVNSWNTDPPPFDPLSLNPLSWLDRDRGMYVDAAGTIPAVVGDPVGRWEDMAGGAYVQTVSAQRPQRTATGLSFAGGPTGNIWLRSTQSVGTPLEVVAVAQRISGGFSSWSALVSSSVAGSSPNPVGDWWYIGGNLGQARVAVRKGTGGIVQAFAPNVFQLAVTTIFNARLTDTELLGDVGGTTFTAANTADIVPSQVMQVGGNVNTYEIAEVFVFDRILTSGERSQLIAYLEAKHGI